MADYDVIIAGGGNINVNKSVEVVAPAIVVTDKTPDAPVPTTAVILVALTTTNDVASVPPNFTLVAPVKFVPVIVTVVPTTPVVGVNEKMIGDKPVFVTIEVAHCA